MRKLTILALVLAMVSAANATVLSWSVDAITLGVPGETAVVQLIADNADVYAAAKWVGYTPSAASPIGTISNIVARAAAGPDAVVENPLMTGYPGWWLVHAIDFDPPSNISSGVQYDVTISALDLGTFQVSSDYYGNNDILEITIFPEPTSVVLLVVGSLALRIKRRR